MRVKDRHVIYVQGYDPRGLAQYYRMFRTELRKFARLYGLTAAISRPQGAANNEVASWSIETSAEDWQTRTTYDFLRFEDFIQRDLAAPIWKIVFQGIWFYLGMVFQGTIAGFAKANWRFSTFVTYPHLVLLAEAVVLGAFAYLVHGALAALGIPALFSIVAAAVLFVAALEPVLRRTEKRTYVLYLLCDTIWTWQFAHRARPEWDERLDRFAEHLSKVVRDSAAQEILLIGHSSGSFLATEILARALDLDPALGRHGPRLVLLTLGSNYPVIGYQPAAQYFRDHLRQLAREPSIEWIDCQSRKDVMNFFDFDPIAAHGIDLGPERRNPTIVPVRFREIVDPARYNVFRWQFFRVHFQFVMANDRPNAYDFFMIACGPVPVRERMAFPDAALAIATAGPAGRARAWDRLDAPGTPGNPAYVAAGLGTTARSSG